MCVNILVGNGCMVLNIQYFLQNQRNSFSWVVVSGVGRGVWLGQKIFFSITGRGEGITDLSIIEKD